MKKSVIILIAIIYVASIAIVSFFGLNFKSYNEKIYVNEVKIVNEGVSLDETGKKYVVIRPNSYGELVYKLECVITPDDASAKELDFQYDKEIDYVSVGDDGTVRFDRAKMGPRGAVDITVVSTDGTGVSDSITIYAFG